jgi:hypothetical protein
VGKYHYFSGILTANVLVALVSLTAKPSLGMVIWSEAQPFNTNAQTDVLSDYYVHFTTDGNGKWVCVWCAGNLGIAERDFDIFVSRSGDNGATWTEPAILDPFATGPPEIKDDFRPHVYTDGAGHWIATWYSSDNHGGTIGDDTDILVSRSTDNGATWTSSVPLNSDAASDQDVYSYASDGEPDLAYDGSGSWIAVWNKLLDLDGESDLYISQSTDHGATWSELTLLHPSMASDSGDDWGYRIATDRAGHWVVVWSSRDPLGGTIGTDDDILVSCSTNGLTWTDPAPLNSDANTDGDQEDNSPRITSDGTGRWLTVWYSGVYPDYDIKVSHSDDNGATWSPVEYLNDNALTDAGRDASPVPATDGSGNWIVVWQSDEPLTPPVGTDHDIFYSHSSDNGVTWSSPGVLNSYGAILGELGYDRDPEIAHAGDGRYYAIWGSTYDLGGLIGSEYDLIWSRGCLPTLSGDHECDGDVDLDDFAAFQVCFTLTGPVPDDCNVFDFEGDNDVDLDDFAVFSAALAGPNG